MRQRHRRRRWHYSAGNDDDGDDDDGYVRGYSERMSNLLTQTLNNSPDSDVLELANGVLPVNQVGGRTGNLGP